MNKTEKELMTLMTIVAANGISRKLEKLFLTLCLSELIAFSDDASVQDAVENMLEIVKDGK